MFSSAAHFNSSHYVLFFHQPVIGFHCMLGPLVKTVAYSSAKINECIDFVELKRMAFYSGQKPKSTLFWKHCATKILSLAISDKLNHNCYSTQWNSTQFASNAHNYTERHGKNAKYSFLMNEYTSPSLVGWYTQYARTILNSEPEVASVFRQLETDNHSLMSLQHSNSKNNFKCC